MNPFLIQRESFLEWFLLITCVSNFLWEASTGYLTFNTNLMSKIIEMENLIFPKIIFYRIDLKIQKLIYSIFGKYNYSRRYAYN